MLETMPHYLGLIMKVSIPESVNHFLSGRLSTSTGLTVREQVNQVTR